MLFLWLLNLLNTFKSHFHGLDETVAVEFHAVDASHTVVSVGFAERTAVIHDVPFVFAWNLYYRVVAGTGSHVGVLLKDFAYTVKRAEG